VLAASTLPAGLFAGLVPALAIPGFAGAMTSCRNWTAVLPVSPGQNSQPTSVFTGVQAVATNDVRAVGIAE
jgi:hypothetical protein